MVGKLHHTCLLKKWEASPTDQSFYANPHKGNEKEIAELNAMGPQDLKSATCTRIEEGGLLSSLSPKCLVNS